MRRSHSRKIFPSVIAGKTGRHNYTEWDQVLMGAGAAHPAMNPYLMPANAECRRTYSKDMCARSLEILNRTVMVPTHPEAQPRGHRGHHPQYRRRRADRPRRPVAAEADAPQPEARRRAEVRHEGRTPRARRRTPRGNLVRPMSVRLAINPITWVNDDMPSLGRRHVARDHPVGDPRLPAFRGTEMSFQFPKTSAELRPLLNSTGWSDLGLVRRPHPRAGPRRGMGRRSCRT